MMIYSIALITNNMLTKIKIGSQIFQVILM